MIGCREVGLDPEVITEGGPEVGYKVSSPVRDDVLGDPMLREHMSEE